MSYSADPVADAAAYYEPLYAAADSQANAERVLDEEFTAACAKGDANAIASFAPDVRDFYCRAMGIANTAPRRAQQLHEVMQESLDYPKGPSMSEAMQLILNAAYSPNLEATRDQAKRLIERMATTWASHNVTAE